MNHLPLFLIIIIIPRFAPKGKYLTILLIFKEVKKIVKKDGLPARERLYLFFFYGSVIAYLSCILLYLCEEQNKKEAIAMMMNSVIMYLVQSEAEIPIQPMPNTAYYIVGREVRIFDNAGQMAIYVLPPKTPAPDQNEVFARLDKCEQKINRVFRYLTSFTEGDTNDQQ